MAQQAAGSRPEDGESGVAGSGCCGTESVSSSNAETASASSSANGSSPLGSTAPNRLTPVAQADASGQPGAEQTHDGLQGHESQQRPMSVRSAGPQMFDRPMDFR